MLAVPRAQIHRRRFVLAPLATKPSEELLECPVAVLGSQQAQRVDRGSLAAAQFQGAAGPVREAMVEAEGQRVHASSCI